MRCSESLQTTHAAQVSPVTHLTLFSVFPSLSLASLLSGLDIASRRPAPRFSLPHNPLLLLSPISLQIGGIQFTHIFQTFTEKR